MSMYIDVNANNFEQEVLKSNIPVCVDFWAPWCGPCKAMNPIIEEISNKHTSFKIVKINLDDNTDLGAKYRVRSIPTLMLFKNGEVVSTKVGSGSVTEIEQWIKDNIA